ncbi:3-alpha-hydroxysteroid sulfotransferase-like [Amblyomma americanum]
MPGRRPYRQVIDGVPRCPMVDPDIFRKSLSFRAANGDVVLHTYPKSGSHWIQYTTQLILNSGERISTYSEFTQNFRAIEYTDCTNWNSDLPLRLFLTHQPLQRETMNKAAKYIYIARNPWDVCASQYRMTTELTIGQFQDGTFEEFFDPFIEGDLGYGNYFDHVASGHALKNESSVFFVTYEELKKDIRDVVLRLGHFLGEGYGRALESDHQMLQNVMEWSKAEHMRKVIVFDLKGNQVSEWDDVFKRNKLQSKYGVDGDKSKYALVKDAKVGSWKEYFTPELLNRFEKKIQEEGNKASFVELWANIRAEAIALSRVSN